jgi:hypothetical protein
MWYAQDGAQRTVSSQATATPSDLRLCALVQVTGPRKKSANPASGHSKRGMSASTLVTYARVSENTPYWRRLSGPS